MPEDKIREKVDMLSVCCQQMHRLSISRWLQFRGKTSELCNIINVYGSIADRCSCAVQRPATIRSLTAFQELLMKQEGRLEQRGIHSNKNSRYNRGTVSSDQPELSIKRSANPCPLTPAMEQHKASMPLSDERETDVKGRDMDNLLWT